MSATSSPEDKRRGSDLSAGMTQPIPKKSVQIRTDKPRPHLCAICTRGFARLEHLKRHERAHTNEKPYQCAACGRCFARRDLVLRHQQKLHLNIFLVARRGLLPALLGQTGEPEAVPLGEKVPNESVIILRNNTSAKAPLPDSLMFPRAIHGLQYLDLTGLSPSHESPHTGSMSTGPKAMEHSNFANEHTIPRGSSQPAYAQFKTSGVIPSPNTNSYHNTPSLSGTAHGTNSSFSDLDMLQNHNINVNDYTQQPSPLTGDSPDLKDKQKLLKEKARQDFLNDQLEFKSSLDLKKFANYGKNLGQNPRHASFLAVSGLSYTNLQDALTIKTNQMPQGPPQVGFATPQLTATDLEYIDVPGQDLNGNDLDWYSLNFNEPHRPQSQVNGHESHASKDPVLGKPKNGSGFKMSLNTIPSESHIAGAFLAENAQNQIIASHQFQNPDHPHHIPGTTPMDFGFSLGDDPLQVADFPKMQYGTGFTQLTQDMVYLQEQETAKQQETPRPTSSRPISSGEEKSQDAQDLKRRKVGFVNDIDDLSWIDQLKGIPLPNELPLASTDTGFVGMPFVTDEFQSDEVFSLFKLKQDDLVKQKSQVDLRSSRRSPEHDLRLSSLTSRRSSRARFTIGDSSEIITDDLRARIIDTSNVADEHFPPKEDLNAYMKLYGEEFNTYFLFIHLPTLKSPMVDNFENIPMILAMCSIGALYSYHDSNTLLLFNLSKYHIHRFFENEVTPNKLQLKKVPIMAHQCLVLHIFISMFLNEPNMVEITSRQMSSMVGLIRSTNFHRPLEQFLAPPPTMTNPNDQGNLQNNFGYFIMAQTRIRTILTFYQLEVIRSILLGCPIPMSGAEIKSGIPCNDEALWKAGNSTEWVGHFSQLQDKNIVEVSNNQSLLDLAEQLNGAQASDSKSTFDKALVLLMYVHEQILTSYAKHSDNFDPFTWRVECRPQLEYLISSWEEYFVKNGGSAIINNQNEAVFNKNSDLKLILPLLLLAKIRLSVNFSPVTATVLNRDWNGMNVFLKGLENDVEGLKEACKYALDTLDLWIHNISVVNDAKQTSVRTPVFFLTAVFISVMVLGKTLDLIENGKALSVFERSFWLKCEKALRSIETTLSSHDQTSYSEYLNRQSGGVFDLSQSQEFHKNIKAVLNEKPAKVRLVKKCRLLTHALGLGVRILADAPLWPLAMRFAEALKHMATDINSRA